MTLVSVDVVIKHEIWTKIRIEVLAQMNGKDASRAYVYIQRSVVQPIRKIHFLSEEE